MTNTKTYENITVTVTCQESGDDIEMLCLINKLKKAQEVRESVEKTYIPKIEVIGKAKWSIIVNQLLELCKVAEEIGIRNQLGNFMSVTFNRDDTGKPYTLRLEWYSPLKNYTLSYGYAGSIYQNTTLSPVDGYCPKSELEDKDGWLAKWDEYDIYNRFRSKLMKEIQRRTNIETAKTSEVLERYKEFTGDYSPVLSCTNVPQNTH